jgi:hypothetical protein
MKTSPCTETLHSTNVNVAAVMLLYMLYFASQHLRGLNSLNTRKRTKLRNSSHLFMQLVWETKLECTFKPQTNQRRLEGSEDYQDCSTSRFDQLFLDAESRRRRQEEYLLWYPEG